MSRHSSEKMNRPQTDPECFNHYPLVEFVVFLVVSSIGIYALGTGFTVLSATGEEANLSWFAVVALAVAILVAQMRRVYEHWPHRTDGRQQHVQQITE